MSRPIVFTDLDGTLLDHHDYSFAAALPALDECRRRGVPVVFTSSKTRAEIDRLRKLTRNTDPFISENGGGVFFPENGPKPSGAAHAVVGGFFAVVLGARADDLVSFISGLDYRGRITPFFDMTVEDVMIATDLSEGEARLAKSRDFSMPFTLNDPRFLETLEREAESAGYAVTRGGRFYHLVGAAQDKGRAMDIIRAAYGNPTTMALGDSYNDAAMLDRADVPVLVMKPDGGYADIDLPPHGIRTTKPGPAGWCDAVMDFLLHN